MRRGMDSKTPQTGFVRLSPDTEIVNLPGGFIADFIVDGRTVVQVHVRNDGVVMGNAGASPSIYGDAAVAILRLDKRRLRHDDGECSVLEFLAANAEGVDVAELARVDALAVGESYTGGGGAGGEWTVTRIADAP